MAEEAVAPEVNLEELDKVVHAALDEGTESSNEPAEYSNVEQKAMDMGWNPDPESLKDSGKEWIPAGEFVRNQTFFSEIKNLKRQVKQQEKVTAAFKEHNSIIYDKAYTKAVADLKKAKVDAAQDMDLEKMLQIDDQIDDLAKNKRELEEHEQAAFTVADWNTAFEDFTEQNPWYEADEIKKTYADKIGWQFAQQNPTTTPEAVYEFVVATIKEKFVDKSVVTVKPRISAVASPTRTSPKRSGSKSMSDIPEEHRGIARTLIRSGEISEADYLKQYFAE